MDLDADTLYLCLASVFAIALVGSLPAFVRVIGMRRAERLLGWAYWPFLDAIDNRESRHKEPPRDG
jgi:hypothetical protein